LKLLALPSEARENNRINNLPEFLGRTSFIETQDVSDRLPKHLSRDLQDRHIAGLYRVPDAIAATIARLAYAVAMNRREALFASDARRPGGVVTVAPGRDRVSREPIYRVSHVYAGADVAFQSLPICDGNRAIEAAKVLAEFTGAVVRR
jgi:N-formylglutamate amidohydrolase